MSCRGRTRFQRTQYQADRHARSFKGMRFSLRENLAVFQVADADARHIDPRSIRCLMPRNPRNPRFIKHADFNMRYLLRIMPGKTVVNIQQYGIAVKITQRFSIDLINQIRRELLQVIKIIAAAPAHHQVIGLRRRPYLLQHPGKWNAGEFEVLHQRPPKPLISHMYEPISVTEGALSISSFMVNVVGFSTAPSTVISHCS